jgi:hypothetical protein
MQRDQTFCVIGLRMNGDRAVITKDTDRETAERIVNLMNGTNSFTELYIARIAMPNSRLSAAPSAPVMIERVLS